MTKYSEQVIEAAREALDWAEGLVTTDALATVVFDSLERAPWWEEVTDGNAALPAGCPVRREVATGDATERTYASPFTAWQLLGEARVFIDTRWTPPTPPLAVGDVIETVEDLERLPEETLLFSTRLHTYWMEKEGHFIAIGSDRWLVADEAASYGPFTIRWLPEADPIKEQDK